MRGDNTDHSSSETVPSADDLTGPARFPAFRGALLGRDDEIRRLQEALRSNKLVTLVGPGGIGKTRLAAEAARAVASQYADGVVWVDLIPLRDPRLVVASAASALGVEEGGGRPLIDAVSDGLLYRNLLVVFDNCEHVVAGVRSVASRLLASCPAVTVLCTSRQPLGMPDEERLEVAALSTEGPSGPRGSDAVRLFEARASEAHRGFRLTTENADLAAEICMRLDGIPLAIELAAARTGLLGLADIADRLDRRLDLLSTGTPSTSRHQTLRAVFDWSYDLLEEAEQRLFDRLGPFAGGFTIDAAEEVCSGGPVPRNTVVELLGRLIDQSLVSVSQGGERARFHRMDTLRIYASERLAETPEDHVVRRRHAEWFNEVVSRATRSGPQELPALAVEAGNFRSALSWAIENDGRLAADLVASLTSFWEATGQLSEARQWTSRALARWGALDEAPVALLEAAGSVAVAQADYTAARSNLEAARSRIADADTAALARIETKLGVVARYEGDLQKAEALFSGALVRQQGVADRRAAAVTLVELGHVAALRADRDTARLLYGRAVVLAGQAGDEAGVARGAVLLGELAARNSEVTVARLHYDEAAETFRRLDDKRGLATVLTALGRLSIVEDDVEAGRDYQRQALALYDELGDRRGQANTLAGLAFLAYMASDHLDSEELFRRAAMVRRSLGDRRGLAVAMVGVANALFLRISPPPDLVAAKQLCEEALEIQSDIGDRVNTAWTRYSLAEITRDMGLYEESRGHAAASIELYSATSHGAYNGVAHASLAAVTVAEGDPEAATSIAAEALRLARQAGISLQMMRCVELIARICTARGQLGDAAQLYAAAGAARRLMTPGQSGRLGQQRVLEADRVLLEERLAPDELAARRSAGEVMSIDEAADMAAALCHPGEVAPQRTRRPGVAATTVQVLGSFSVGGSPAVSSGAPARLVKFLAVTGPTHRDEVVERLWPDAPPGVGRRRLHNVLTRARKSFGDVVARDGDTLRIDRAFSVDAELFITTARKALALADSGSTDAAPALNRALECYTGELLPEDRYEDWAVSARERTSQLQVRVLHAAARVREDIGDPAGALALLERAIELDHLDEGHYVAAARLLIRVGWRERARQLVRRARAVGADLGLRPSEELLTIERDLGASDHK